MNSANIALFQANRDKQKQTFSLLFIDSRVQTITIQLHILVYVIICSMKHQPNIPRNISQTKLNTSLTFNYMKAVHIPKFRYKKGPFYSMAKLIIQIYVILLTARLSYIDRKRIL